MFSPLTLMELSDDDKLKILEQCDLESIFALRRTCHDFRNLIDDKKPDGKIEDITVSSYHHNDSNSLTVYARNNRRIEADYHPEDEECTVARKYGWKEEHFIPGQNPVDVFIRDFKNIMSYQKNVLSSMSLNLTASNGSIELIQHYLKSRKTLIKVERLELHLPKQSQIVELLPFFDAKYLQSIEINFNDSNELSQELVSLDQWKSAKIATIFEFNVGMMDHCLHFKEITVYTDDSVRDAADIPAFKRKMHESRHLQTMTMFVDTDYPIFKQLGIMITLENDGKEFTH